MMQTNKRPAINTRGRNRHEPIVATLGLLGALLLGGLPTLATAQPTVSISDDVVREVASGGQVALSATVEANGGEPLTYLWSQNANSNVFTGNLGTFSDAVSATPTWTAPMNPANTNEGITLTLVVTDRNGVSALDRHRVNVRPAPGVNNAAPVFTPDTLSRSYAESLSADTIFLPTYVSDADNTVSSHRYAVTETSPLFHAELVLSRFTSRNDLLRISRDQSSTGTGSADITVTVTDPAGASDTLTITVTITAPTSVAPGQITDLQITGRSPRRNLSWTPPSGDVTRYEVEYSTTTSPAGPWTPDPRAAGLTVPSLSTFQRGAITVFRVRACNTIGCGPWSNEDVVTPPPMPTPPGAVTGLTTTQSGDDMVLSWTAPTETGSGVIAGYRVERGLGGLFTPLVNGILAGTTFTDSTALPGVGYTWRVTPLSSFEVSGVPLEGPPATDDDALSNDVTPSVSGFELASFVADSTIRDDRLPDQFADTPLASGTRVPFDRGNAGSTLQIDAVVEDTDARDQLSFAWSISPDSLRGELSGPDSPRATWTPHKNNTAAPIEYTFTLRVTDLGGNTATSTLTVILAVTGLPPVADASRDSDVNTLTLPIGTTTVVLDGSDSVANADPATLTYLWQLYNPPAGVLLTGADTATPTLDLSGVTGITAPAQVNINLLVTNVRGGLDTDTFYVLLLPLSTANAGVDQSVRAGTEVTLDGSASQSGSSGDATLTYRWTQTAGPTVSLATPVSAMRTFTAPDVTAPTTLTFSLDVENSVSALQTDTVNITVMPNAAPVAMAGADQRAPTGALVTLTGSATDSDDGAGLTYEWTQLGAPDAIVALTADANTGTATFTAPAITLGTSTTLLFRLIVTDPQGKSSAPDEVSVTVDAALVLSFVDAAGAAVTDLTLTEDGGAQTFRVKAQTSSGAVFNAAQTVTVALLPSMDAGVVGVTSSTTSPTIVIPANASEGTGAFTLTPRDNTIDELDNTVTVSATLADFTINTLTFPLTDDDQTPPGFTLTIAGQAEVTEHGGAQTLMLTVGVIGATQFRADQTVAVRLTGVGGSPSVDLEPFEQVNIVVPAGAAASAPTAVTLTPVNDTRTEGNEEFELFTASGATARFTLIDDDVALRLLVDTNTNLDGIQNTVREDVGRVPVRVTLLTVGRCPVPPPR